jgi:hypothetical protein
VVFDTDNAERLGFTGSDEQLQLLSSMVLAKTVSPCEAAAALAGFPVVDKTCKVVYIPTFPPEQRCQPVGKAKVVIIPKVELYCGRPTEFEDLTLTKYFKQYTLNKKPLVSLGDVLGVDSFGNSVQRRAAGEPVRFSMPHPKTNPEGFFYNVLLDNVPFRLEDALLSPENGPRSYYSECCLRGLISDEEDLEVGNGVVCSCSCSGVQFQLLYFRAEHGCLVVCLQHLIEQFCQDHLYTSSTQASILEELLQAHDPREPVSDKPTPRPAAIQEEDLLDELADTEGLEPNAEQAAVEAALLSGATGIAVLSGGPGTGKTFLTRRLIHQWRQAGRSLVVAATTGAAATRISRGAQTVHSAFNIPVDGMYLGSMRQYTDLYQKLNKAEIIIIDELAVFRRPL